MASIEGVALIVVQRILDFAVEHGRWPTFVELDRPLFKERRVDLQPVLAELAAARAIAGLSHPSYPRNEDQVALRWATLASCEGAQPVLDAIAVAVRLAADVEINAETSDPSISSAEVAAALSAEPTDALVRLLGVLLKVESWGWSSAGSSVDGSIWTYTVDRRVRAFEGVQTIDDVLLVLDPERRVATAGEVPSRDVTIVRLLDEADDIDDAARALQESPATGRPAVRDVSRRYRKWYAEALAVVDESLRDRFIDAFEGGQFIHRIRSYLANPLARNPLWTDDAPDFMSPWLEPYDTTFHESFEIQLELLQRTALSSATELGATSPPDEEETAGSDSPPEPEAVEEPVDETLARLATLFQRMPEYLATLQRGSAPNVAVKIETERDLHVCVEAALRLHFADVRPEEPVQSRAGSGSRVDFFLPRERAVIELKMTRDTLRDADLGEELLTDLARYGARDDFEHVLFVIYDPRRLLRNPQGLRSDLVEMDGRPREILILN